MIIVTHPTHNFQLNSTIYLLKTSIFLVSQGFHVSNHKTSFSQLHYGESSFSFSTFQFLGNDIEAIQLKLESRCMKHMILTNYIHTKRKWEYFHRSGEIVWSSWVLTIIGCKLEEKSLSLRLNWDFMRLLLGEELIVFLFPNFNSQFPLHITSFVIINLEHKLEVWEILGLTCTYLLSRLTPHAHTISSSQFPARYLQIQSRSSKRHFAK